MSMLQGKLQDQPAPVNLNQPKQLFLVCEKKFFKKQDSENVLAVNYSCFERKLPRLEFYTATENSLR